MDANYKLERNTRGYFQVVDQDGSPAKEFKGELFTTERNGQVAILTKNSEATTKEKKVEDK